MGKDIRKEVIKILAKIGPEWSDNMEDIVDTEHRIGRAEIGHNSVHKAPTLRWNME